MTNRFQNGKNGPQNRPEENDMPIQRRTIREYSPSRIIYTRWMNSDGLVAVGETIQWVSMTLSGRDQTVRLKSPLKIEEVFDEKIVEQIKTLKPPESIKVGPYQIWYDRVHPAIRATAKKGENIIGVNFILNGENKVEEIRCGGERGAPLIGLSELVNLGVVNKSVYSHL